METEELRLVELMQAISRFTERRDCVENREKNLQGEGEGVRVTA